jgi:radical SAM superfamily enzyme YgiQ (UPF0313 family)
MHLTLIKPKIGRRQEGPYIDEGRMEPLMLAVLAGMVPPDVEVSLVDDRFESIDYSKPTDLVAVTVETYTAKRAYEISAAYQSRGIPVVMGGMHATLIPEEVAQHADTLFTGDGEGAWSQLLEDFLQGKMKKRYDSSRGMVQPGFQPDRSIFHGKKYLSVSLLQFSRGCPNYCIYCATGAYFDHEHYCRNIDEVLDEIGDKKILFFVDDNFISHKEEVKNLLRRLIPKKLFWVGQVSLDITLDPELMDLMEQSGCLGFVVGFESLSPENILWMNKSQTNIYAEEGYEKQITILQKHGFQIWAAFTLGHDFDTVESIQETVKFALRHKFAFAAYNILMPYPGTPLYDMLKEEGRLLFDGKWWISEKYHFNQAAFIPKNMTPDELTAACAAARKKFNSLPSIIFRIFHLKTNLKTLRRLFFFLRYNILFSREVKKKEAMLFGEN